jgi:Ion channel
MAILSIILGVVIVVAVLLDAFETVLLPRRVKRSFRLTALFFRNTWRPWLRISDLIPAGSRREAFLSYFGPLSIIGLLLFWAAGLILGFALLQYGLGEHVQLGNEQITFARLIYLSGETFFTLGLGDIAPVSAAARVFTVLEAGMGFAFIAMVIGYLPTLYSAFSRREIEISLLDARAGSPPSASELLRRLGCCPDQGVLDGILRDWERWAAEILESHLSYPVLSFYRSQHGNQSWLAAMTAILDTSALLMVGINSIRADQAKLTFAAARHAVVDLAQVVNARYDAHAPDRLPTQALIQLRQTLAEDGLRLTDGDEAEQRLIRLRSLYESYVWGLAQSLRLTLPQWLRSERRKDNWQGGPWDRIIQAKGLAETVHRQEEHF